MTMRHRRRTISMTRRQRNMRRIRSKPRMRSKAALGLLLLLHGRDHRRAVGRRLHRRDRRDRPRHRRAQADRQGRDSSVYAADGSLLGYVQSDIVREQRPWRRHAGRAAPGRTVAIEDERFYEHDGVDPEGIVRAAVKNITSGETLQGGSTITQQLVRALYIQDPQQDYKRKIREAKLAQELEDEHSKRWILEQYLNVVPYGTVARPHRARRRGRRAGLLREARQGPDAGRVGAARRPAAGAVAVQPVPEPARARSSAATRCSQAMADNGYISQARAEKAMEKGLGPQARHDATRASREPYFFDYVEQLLIESYGAGRLPPGRPEDPHDDRPEDAGAGPPGDRVAALPEERPELGDRLDRPGERLHQGDGVERHLQRPHVQPRRAGPPPAGLGVQDDGARDGDPRGRRPAPHDLRRRSRSTCRSRATGPGRSRPTTTPTAARWTWSARR